MTTPSKKGTKLKEKDFEICPEVNVCSCCSKEKKKIKKKKKSEKKDKEKEKEKDKDGDQIVYGEFINTFIFSSSSSSNNEDGGGDDDNSSVSLPIVQPGSTFAFPITTTAPIGDIRYEVDEVSGRSGLRVPRGRYLISWKFNPSPGASVALLVNDEEPVTDTGFPYTRIFSVGGGTIVDEQFLVDASLKKDNFISLVNVGKKLLTLDNIPNSRIETSRGVGGIIVHIRIQKQKLLS
jgi:hypothetical protein